jgi:transposase
MRQRLIGARDLIIDSAPILAWRRRDPDAAFGHAPAQHPRPLLLGYRVHTLLCRGSGLPIFFLLSPANVHDAPFAQPLLAWALRLYQIRPRVIRLDAAYWGLRLIAWIHTVLGASAIIPWNPKRQKNRSCLPPTWTKEELGKRSGIERFFGRVFLFFRLQRPPLYSWSAIASQVALTYTASIVVALVAQQAGRPDLIRSPKRVLAHLWEKSELWNALFTAQNETICSGSECSFTTFCGYHSTFGTNSIYAVVPYVGGVQGCDTASSPNNDNDADSAINVVSHEQMEAATDPLLNAWTDSSGQEIGDKCNFTFGPTASDGSNVNWNGNPYLVQEEWDNAQNGCVIAGP